MPLRGMAALGPWRGGGWAGGGPAGSSPLPSDGVGGSGAVEGGEARLSGVRRDLPGARQGTRGPRGPELLSPSGRLRKRCGSPTGRGASAGSELAARGPRGRTPGVPLRLSRRRGALAPSCAEGARESGPAVSCRSLCGPRRTASRAETLLPRGKAAGAASGKRARESIVEDIGRGVRGTPCHEAATSFHECAAGQDEWPSRPPPRHTPLLPSGAFLEET